MRKPLTVLACGLLAACGAIPLQLVVIDRMTGEMAVTSINARQTSGPIDLVFRGELYSGIWTSVRDAGFVSSGTVFLNDTYGNATFGDTSSRSTATGGNAVANLRSASGKLLRCQIRYSLGSGPPIVALAVGPSVTGAGECFDEAGKGYDVQASTR